MNAHLKKNLPHLAAIILCIGLPIIYMAPSVLDNKELMQPDVVNSFAWGKDLRDFHQETGQTAYWSNSMFGGMPFNHTYPLPTPSLFRQIEKVMFSILPTNVMVLIILMIGFYIFMIALGCKPGISLIGAIAYTFASFNIISIGAGHVNKVLVMATMAPIIGGIILCYRKKFFWGIIVTLIFTGFNIMWGHQQITYYLLIIVLILAVVYLVFAIQEKTLKDYFKSSALLIVVAILAIAPEFGHLYSTADYSKDTMRGGAVLQNNPDGQKESSGLDIDYAFAWSYGKGETMTFLIPNFYGASSAYNIGEKSAIYDFYRKAGASPKQAEQISRQMPMYWGDQPGTSGPVYMGAVICFLFVLGLMIIKGKEKWWILTATVVAVALSWGRHFPAVNDFLFYHLPLYNKFRTPSMSLVIAQVTMSALAVLALKEIFDNSDNRKIYLKPVYMAAGITGGLCLLYALFGNTLMSFSGMGDESIQSQGGHEMLAAIVSDRKSMLSSDAWRSFFLIALTTGTLWLCLNKSFKIIYATAIIGLMVFFDIWVVDKRFMNFESFFPQKETKVNPTPVDLQILRDTDPHYRVFNLTTNTFNEAMTSYFHKSIGGYSPAKLRRYQDIIDYHFSKGININVLNMLNTKYVIIPNEQRQPSIQQNTHALGNVWFVNDVKWVDSPDEEIVALKDFDPSQTAIIDKEWQGMLQGWASLKYEIADSTAAIRMTDYVNPGHIIYASSSGKTHLAVFSEVFYKTWKAYIDGVEVPLVRVNYILRGLEVPAGQHTIEMKCIDEVYLFGEKISKIASISVTILLLCLIGFEVRSSRKKRR